MGRASAPARIAAICTKDRVPRRARRGRVSGARNKRRTPAR
ncbi:hypothetical protein GZL_04347 [Streptomyces sp. 769]|nr:hypothetical protein GZL_04347 [Streptomyces sp. 769]